MTVQANFTYLVLDGLKQMLDEGRIDEFEALHLPEPICQIVQSLDYQKLWEFAMQNPALFRVTANRPVLDAAVQFQQTNPSATTEEFRAFLDQLADNPVD